MYSWVWREPGVKAGRGPGVLRLGRGRSLDRIGDSSDLLDPRVLLRKDNLLKNINSECIFFLKKRFNYFFQYPSFHIIEVKKKKAIL